MIEKLVLNNWRQFADLNIQLHERLTVLVGANGVGKTVALNLIGSHYAQIPGFPAVPHQENESGFRPDVHLRPNVSVNLYPLERIPFDGGEMIRMGSPVGFFEYSDGRTIVLVVALDQRSAQYQVYFVSQPPAISGCHVPSHRAFWSYAPVEEDELLEDISPPVLLSSLKAHYLDPDVRQFPFQVKRALVSLLTKEQKPEILSEFENKLRHILPREVAFQSFFRVRREVGVHADNYQFSVDAVSGGIASVICIAWLVYLHSLVDEAFVVTIDEPENHLHPSMQKTFLSGLVEQFPSARFVVATHSPFIVTACENSNVYKLDLQPHPMGTVSSLLWDQKSKSLTPDDVFRSILGLEYVMPEWAALRLDQIIEKHRNKPLNAATLSEITEDLENAGLASNNMSESLNLVVKRLNDQNQERP